MFIIIIFFIYKQNKTFSFVVCVYLKPVDSGIFGLKRMGLI